MSKERVLLDANVLYPYFLRDLLLSLFGAGHYKAKWTDRINTEWSEHLLQNEPSVEPRLVQRTITLMNAIQPPARVTGYEGRIHGLSLPDPDDRHVLAAAIASGAGKIVTWNQKDFPIAVLASYGIVAQCPDQFLFDLLDSDPSSVIRTLRDMRQRLNRPSFDAAAFLAAMGRIRLRRTKLYWCSFTQRSDGDRHRSVGRPTGTHQRDRCTTRTTARTTGHRREPRDTHLTEPRATCGTTDASPAAPLTNASCLRRLWAKH
jgi:predicted nucleic acid-binding protein